jgi:GNAT superfamily N-acetyltransferase
MTITHELITLPEAKPRTGESTPKYPGRRAVLLVSAQTEDSGEHRLKQRVFFGEQCVVTLETLVGASRIHLTDSMDFVIASEELRSRGLGTLLLRRAVDFAYDKARSTSVQVRSLLLSEVDETDPDNKARRDRCYKGIGFDLSTQPASRQLYQPLSDFRNGLGAPAGIESTVMSDGAFYGPFLAQHASELRREALAAEKAAQQRSPESPKNGKHEPWLASGNVLTAVAVVTVTFGLLSLWWLVS